MLIVHGAGGGYDQGKYFAKLIGGNYRWIAPSRFGFLGSPVPDGANSAQQADAYTVAAIQQLALDKHLPVLVGVEMTTTWKGELTDLLCFGFDPNHNVLNDLAQELLRRQQENTRQVYENLQRQGYILPSDGLSAVLAKPSSEQPHALIAFLKEHGYGLGHPSA